jgi:hypothetical protein
MNRKADSNIRCTTAQIWRAAGSLRRQPGTKPLAEECAEHKRQEWEVEEGKYASAEGRRRALKTVTRCSLYQFSHSLALH